MKEYVSFWQKNKFRNLWQHPVWAEFQRSVGSETWLLTAYGASALVIKHRLPFGLSWLEVPRGPLFENEKGLSEVISEIVKVGKKEKSVFIRMSSYEELGIGNWKLGISKDDHHPQTSLVLDLAQSESDILKQMKPKGRYNIKLAEKHGITVKPSNDVGAFYNILTKTGNRDGFGIHPKSYYEKMLKALGNNAQLLLAEYEGKVIAGGIFVYLDEWGIYYYGASDSEFRNLMAPYLVQWTAITESKKRGCVSYDFLGIAPEDTKNHPWAGVTDFKKKFGGQVVSYPSAKELILKPVWYWIYRVYRKIK
jgi:lipid II:glycine glycyltransferase (peptidoglycan interpeptide bridge formation enzyme)